MHPNLQSHIKKRYNKQKAYELLEVSKLKAEKIHMISSAPYTQQSSHQTSFSQQELS